ncbi:hypothetical protein [Chitinivorax sp. B]|uniref:hypothetical protein n=1 Tax=Chitinivorax sp. B TaxID=2502235 RepID=UPI0010FA42A8|nr:hypothetical protein [Chitinivorax sp. B]
MRIVVQAPNGKKITAYCTDKCGDWFEADANDISSLKKALKGKTVILKYQAEPNRDRIAGPSSDETLVFVKQIEFIRSGRD